MWWETRLQSHGEGVLTPKGTPATGSMLGQARGECRPLLQMEQWSGRLRESVLLILVCVYFVLRGRSLPEEGVLFTVDRRDREGIVNVKVNFHFHWAVIYTIVP